MSRTRSPNYPQISLPEAIQQIEKIQKKEGRNAATDEVLVKLMGYGGLNGSSMAVLSGVRKYGLLEKVGEKESKVSPLAMSILFPHDQAEKAEAIREAAGKPTLFAEISEKWPQQPPSDENLTAYLVRNGFSQSTVGNVIRCYRETMELVTPNPGAYTQQPTQNQELKPPMDPRPRSSTPYETTFVPASGQPFRVTFTGDGIEITGRIDSAERADELVRAVNALKTLLRPVGSGKRPDEQAGGQD